LQLQDEYGHEHVRIEVDGIDALVETNTGFIIYEIKSDLSPKSVVRQALGQLLEYAYHPPRAYAMPVRLVIVGRIELDHQGAAYLDHLKRAFGLPIEYRVVSW
jgi:hypothetical protein